MSSVVLVLGLAACSVAAPPPQSPVVAPLLHSPDELTIRTARLAQNQAILRGDLDSVATFWLSNVVVTAGLGFSFQGSEVYQRAFVLDSAIVYNRQPDFVTVSRNWPLASERGTWTGREHKSGATVISGQYSAMWMKVDGKWRIRSELFVATDCTEFACNWPAATR